MEKFEAEWTRCQRLFSHYHLRVQFITTLTHLESMCHAKTLLERRITGLTSFPGPIDFAFQVPDISRVCRCFDFQELLDAYETEGASYPTGFCDSRRYGEDIALKVATMEYRLQHINCGDNWRLLKTFWEEKRGHDMMLLKISGVNMEGRHQSYSIANFLCESPWKSHGISKDIKSVSE